MPSLILNRQIWFFWIGCAKTGGVFCPKHEKVNIKIKFGTFELVQMPNFILNRKFLFFCSNLPKMEKTLFIIIPKFFTWQGFLIRKFAQQFHSLKINFENSKKVRMTHFNIPVGVNIAGIKNISTTTTTTTTTKAY